MRHARVNIDARAIFQQGVGRHDVGQIHDPVIAFHRYDDPDIDTAHTRLDQLVEYGRAGEIGVLDIDIFLRRAYRLALGMVDLGSRRLGAQHTHLELPGLPQCTFFPHPMRGQRDISQYRRVLPFPIEIVLDQVNHGAGQLQHQVMPLPAVFPADVHAADERDLAIDDRRLDMVTGHPRIGQHPGFNRGPISKIARDFRRRLVPGSRGWGLCFLRHLVADAIHGNFDLDIRRSFFEQIGDLKSEIIAVKNIGSNLDRCLCLVDRIDKVRKELVAIDQDLRGTGDAFRAKHLVESGFPLDQVHTRTIVERRNRFVLQGTIGKSVDE